MREGVVNNHESWADAVFKLLVAWSLTAWGWVTLQHLVLLASLAYSVLQSYVIVRDKLLKKEKAS
jgi:hypothetical protein